MIRASKVTSALLTSVGISNQLAGQNKATRTIQSLVKLSPTYLTGGLDKAIFADGALTFNNNTNISGNGGPNADLYTNNDFTCSNNETFGGSVYSQKGATLSNSCNISKDLWTAGNISGSSPSITIGGDVRSASGTIALSGSVTGTIFGSKSISYKGNCGAPKCVTASPGAPPSVAFPLIQWNTASTPSQWPGFTNVKTIFGCGATSTAAVDWVKANSNILPADTLLATDCFMDFSKATLPLNHSLAIFSFGGFSAAQQAVFNSGDGANHNLYWIVPANVGDGNAALIARPCSRPGINTSSLFSLGANIAMLLYSPCDINFSNHSTHIGQIYGGSSVSISNKFALMFQPLPVYGISNPVLTVKNLNVDPVYEREQ